MNNDEPNHKPNNNPTNKPNNNPNAGGTELPQAEVRPSHPRRISSVWVIPVLAALLAGGLAWRTLSDRGPTITLSLQSADGLEAGKTIVSYRSVPVGTVEDIALSDDIKSVLVTIQMRASSRTRLNKDAKFWVVRPRMGVAGISGLSTLVSGNYIGTDLGPEGGPDGGAIIAQGTPEEVAAAKGSHTGGYLKAMLGGRGAKASKKKARAQKRR